MLKLNNVRKGFFEHSQYTAMRSALDDDLKPVLCFAYFTGCRPGEILSLRWSQVDLAERVVRLEVGTTKNKEARLIPLVAELHEMLAMRKQIRDQYWPNCEWVFFRVVSGSQVKNFRNAWDRVCGGDAESPAKLFHDLRRTGVRNLIRAGVPERVAMMISGHKTRSLLDRYNIVDERDIKQAAMRLSDYFASREAAERVVPEEGAEAGPHSVQ